MTHVAIVCSSIPARHESLLRSLVTWERSARVSYAHSYDICVTLQGMTGDEKWPKSMSVRRTYTGMSGSHIQAYNYWVTKCRADVYIFTHPDMLFPESTVQAAINLVHDDTYVAFKTFWIPQDMTHNLDVLDWSKDVSRLELVPELYNNDTEEHGEFYANRNVRQISLWESSTTYAVNLQTVKRMFPMPDLGHQGYDDPYQAGLRSKLGIKNVTVQDPILFHQWHPSTWDRNFELATKEAQDELSKL